MTRESLELKELVPMLLCDDVPASIAFYRDGLGFVVDERMDDVGKTGWASLSRGSVRLMLASPYGVPEATKVDGAHVQTIYYFYPEDVVALHESLLRDGYEVSDLAVRFYGMKEFEMRDPSGHQLVFGQGTDEPPTPKGP